MNDQPCPPKRVDIYGVGVEAHRPWCPVEILRQALVGPEGIVFRGNLSPKCRCHLKPLENR